MKDNKRYWIIHHLEAIRQQINLGWKDINRLKNSNGKKWQIKNNFWRLLRHFTKSCINFATMIDLQEQSQILNVLNQESEEIPEVIKNDYLI